MYISGRSMYPGWSLLHNRSLLAWYSLLRSSKEGGATFSRPGMSAFAPFAAKRGMDTSSPLVSTQRGCLSMNCFTSGDISTAPFVVALDGGVGSVSVAFVPPVGFAPRITGAGFVPGLDMMTLARSLDRVSPNDAMSRAGWCSCSGRDCRFIPFLPPQKRSVSRRVR